jgi:hypothetical protein
MSQRFVINLSDSWRDLLAALSIALTADKCPCCGRDNTNYDKCTSNDCIGVEALARATSVLPHERGILSYQYELDL